MDLEAEYDNRARVPEHPEIFARWHRDAEAYRQTPGAQIGLSYGPSPRQTIGTVNTSEFFLTATISAAFIFQLGFAAFTLQTLGLLIGGLLAAPLGGVLAKRVPARALMAMVGTLLTLTSIWSIYHALSK